MGPVSLEGSCGRGKVPSSWECLSPTGRSARIFRGSEVGAAASLWQVGQRETGTYGPGQLAALPSPGCTPASVCCGWIQKLRLQRTGQGRGLDVAAQTDGRPGVWCRLQLGVYAVRIPGPLQEPLCQHM